MPIRVDSETGKPQWKDTGADTWNFFSSGESTLIYNQSVTIGTNVSSVTRQVPIIESGKYLVCLTGFFSDWNYQMQTCTINGTNISSSTVVPLTLVGSYAKAQILFADISEPTTLNIVINWTKRSDNNAGTVLCSVIKTA